MTAANKFSFMDILNAQSKADAKTAAVTEYTEIYLNPYDVEETESNFYSQESIEELADAILAVGQQQPTVLGRINGKYKIISGHRRNKANRLLIDRGYEQYKSVRYLYKDVTPATLELSLLVGNAFNRELTAYEKTEQAARLKKALIRARDEDGLEIKGRMRDLIADVLGESPTNVGRMEQINNNLTAEAKEQFKAGNLGITAAYETSKLDEDKQNEIAQQAAAGEDVRAKEIAAKVTEKKASAEYRTPHPEGITSLCYSCKNYSTCNVKTGTCEKCDEYINKAEEEKTDEQRYNEQQAAIDKQTQKTLQAREREAALDRALQPTEQQVYELKLAALYFDDVATGKKSFELCKNDRVFKVGNVLRLNEYANGKETGRYIEANVVYMLEDYNGLKEGYCILGIKVLNVSETDTTSKCEKCTYYGRPSDAPESTPLDCIYRPEEGEEYKPPCEEREAQYEL